jgi:hypothetical protein
MDLDQTRLQAAMGHLNRCFSSAEGIADAIYTADRSMLTGVVSDPECGGDRLCAEAGTIPGQECNIP